MPFRSPLVLYRPLADAAGTSILRCGICHRIVDGPKIIAIKVIFSPERQNHVLFAIEASAKTRYVDIDRAAVRGICVHKGHPSLV